MALNKAKEVQLPLALWRRPKVRSESVEVPMNLLVCTLPTPCNCALGCAETCAVCDQDQGGCTGGGPDCPG